MVNTHSQPGLEALYTRYGFGKSTRGRRSAFQPIPGSSKNPSKKIKTASVFTLDDNSSQRRMNFKIFQSTSAPNPPEQALPYQDIDGDEFGGVVGGFDASEDVTQKESEQKKARNYENLVSLVCHLLLMCMAYKAVEQSEGLDASPAGLPRRAAPA